LLPLYAANEVSSDTRELVARYLERDPELAAAARDLFSTHGLGEVPAAITSEHRLLAFREAKRMMFYRTLVWAGVVSLGVMVLLALALLAARGMRVL
jgi:hypothetical protein